MLDFHNTSLFSRQISTIKSRDEIKFETQIFPRVKITCPIIASPMKDVVNVKIAQILGKMGGHSVIHRFQGIDEQLQMYIDVHDIVDFNDGKVDIDSFNRNCNILASCAIGINDDSIERFEALYNVGCREFCIDVANGSNVNVKSHILKLLDIHSDVSFMVGNFVSVEGLRLYIDMPEVTAFRISISSGYGCSTRNATGFYRPVLDILKECDWIDFPERKIRKSICLIADGGIKEPQDLCKAIAAGADCVMLGSLIANTIESPAIRKGNFKIYSGSASLENQKTYKDVPRYIEGKTKMIPYSKEGLESLVNSFQDGLRSAMSYANARSLDEFRGNVEILKVN